MNKVTLLTLMFSVLLTLGCQPRDRSPGIRLSGTDTEFPADWAFSNEHQEIAVQVATPYLIPHAVTVWCVEVDGDLYLAAFDPDSKNWPGWVRDDPNVRLKIGDRVFAGTLTEMNEAQRIDAVRSAYIAKYELDDSLPADGPGIRYWAVVPERG